MLFNHRLLLTKQHKMAPAEPRRASPTPQNRNLARAPLPLISGRALAPALLQLSPLPRAPPAGGGGAPRPTALPSLPRRTPGLPAGPPPGRRPAPPPLRSRRLSLPAAGRHTLAAAAGARLPRAPRRPCPPGGRDRPRRAAGGKGVRGRGRRAPPATSARAAPGAPLVPRPGPYHGVCVSRARHVPSPPGRPQPRGGSRP